jgi:excisionase family DNA binding protein
MASTSAASQLLSREEAARALRVSLRTLARLTASGELVPVRVGPGRRLVRYAPDDVAAFIRRNREGRPPTLDPSELDYR